MTYQHDMSGFDRSSSTALGRVPLEKMMANYVFVYHADEVNHCPGCTGTNWLIGRVTAECAHCGTALPLAHMDEQSSRPLVTANGKRFPKQGII